MWVPFAIHGMKSCEGKNRRILAYVGAGRAKLDLKKPSDATRLMCVCEPIVKL
jgi:hypothetical protein